MDSSARMLPRAGKRKHYRYPTPRTSDADEHDIAAASQMDIVPIGDVDESMLEYLTLTLPDNFEAACIVRQFALTVDDVYDSTRQQYHSTALLAKLREIHTRDSKILGVTDLDLFIPIFTFVFGEAQVGGCVALMSTHRLRQEFYGLPEDRNLLFARAEKEAIHELGHAHGLGHCRTFGCVMRFSNSVEEVDLKQDTFCEICEPQLHRKSGSTLAA